MPDVFYVIGALFILLAPFLWISLAGFFDWYSQKKDSAKFKKALESK